MCEIEFKQPVQCIGKTLGVAAVHLHHAIAKMGDESAVCKRIWDNLAADLRRNNIRFMSGDFNMALTKVVPELRSRGIAADLCAWYPYFASNAAADQKLHLDSCAIFVIGGNAAVQMPWDESHMHTFASQDASTGLPIYHGPHPGQSWKSYRPLNLKIPDLLGPLLQRAPIAPVAANQTRTYLRVKHLGGLRSGPAAKRTCSLADWLSHYKITHPVSEPYNNTTSQPAHAALHAHRPPDVVVALLCVCFWLSSAFLWYAFVFLFLLVVGHGAPRESGCHAAVATRRAAVAAR